MTLSAEQVALVIGLILNAVAIVKVAVMHERRMTKIEVLLSLLVKRSGITHRREDDDYIETET